jgi:glycerol kinase
MDDRLLLALDQGTTSTRAMVFQADGTVLAQASRPLEQSYPADGWVEHDAQVILDAAVAVMREAVQACGRPLADIAAMGITNQRETMVVWEAATGRPIHPAIVWQDRRTADICEALRVQGAEAEVARITGLLLDPYFSATKIAWILDHVDGARARAETGELLCGTIDTWLVWKLTGGAVHATDATNASRTLLLDLRAQAWSPAMAELFRVPPAMLPQVRDTAGDFGALDADILGAPLPITAVVGDQQGALMGQGCIAPGEIKATFGTGCFMLLHTGAQPHASASRLLTTVAARLYGQATFALEGSLFVAGAAIQWLGEGLGIAGGPQAAEALARQARPDHGVSVVPAFTGLGAPWWDADARGAVLGLTRDSGLAEICAATFDGCALQARDLIEAMRKDAPADFASGAELRIDGGMARSAWFCQRLADLTGMPVRVSAEVEATALGAALFAGLGAGVFKSVEEAAAGRAPKQMFTPTLDEASRQAAYSRWLKAVGRVRSNIPPP